TQYPTFVFIRPTIWKYPAPAFQLPNMTGATFFRTSNAITLYMESPKYDQRTYAANEQVSSAFASLGGSYGFVLAEAGANVTILDPDITMSINGCPSKWAGGIMCTGAGTTVAVHGGKVDVTGTPTGSIAGGLAADTTGTLTVFGKGDYNFVSGPVLDNAQNVAYAAAITPDAALGDRVIVGALTGNITINAPLHPQIGQRLTFSYTQDATGGRTVAYNAVFLTSTLAAGTANQKGAHNFIYDGTNWVQDSTLTWV
ncbi:MAG: hypothetical protein ACYCOX_18615, partial [Acidobacteriaceae bacterium]